MTDNDHSDHIKFWELVVSLIPIIAVLLYIAAYLHELAFCNEFGIPPDLIIIDSTEIFRSIFYLILLVLFIVWFVIAIYAVKKSTNKYKPIFKRIIIIIGLSLTYVIFSYIYPPAFEQYIIFLPAIILFGIYLFLWSLRHKERGLCYLDKLDMDDKKEEQTPSKLDWLARIIGNNGVLLILISIMILWASYWSGIGEVKKQISYLVPSMPQNAVILRIYSDNYICSTLYREYKLIDRSYFIIRSGSCIGLILRYEEVGPLSLKPLDNSQ